MSGERETLPALLSRMYYLGAIADETNVAMVGLRGHIELQSIG